MAIDLRLTVHYGLTIFLSAFLLFQIQPMIGKMILPWFGGSASVWTACMLFFQMVLLLGYLYSHWVVRFLTPYRQSLLHGSLLLVSLLLIPISPSEAWKPAGTENPTLHILGLLTASIGLPYFVLSTTGPLIQAWFARARSGHVPYRLFALSNFGSLLALLAYPVAIEPVLPTRWQSYAWSALFAGFVLACGLLAWRSRKDEPIRAARHNEGPAPRWTEMLLWTLLAACPSILMLAVTSFLTADIAPIPLLWIAPLTLYLLSFILSFDHPRWYHRGIYLPLLLIALGALAYLPTPALRDLPILISLLISLAALFVACMVCHGELAKLKPDASHLTSFFLMLAFGGALGGLFVGVVAPYWFNSNYEFSIGILLTGGIAAITVIPRADFSSHRSRRVIILAVIALLLTLSWLRVKAHLDEGTGATVMKRNFFGALKVQENKVAEYRALMHGRILHGSQSLAADKLDLPTTYYAKNSGIGKVLSAMGETMALRVGIVGIGVGTLTAYGRTGDYYRLYDIDPLVVDIAREHFSFLSRTAATTEVVLGDARLQLEREAAQDFDVLVVDAFSGDSIPIHLLTREAFALYFRHLKLNGILAVHISNKFLDLRQVIRTAADHFGKSVRLIDYDGKSGPLDIRSEWILISGNPRFFDDPHLAEGKDIDPQSGFKPWRDDYSSLFSILK